MSATPANSILGQARASCMISEPRAPGPIIPRRMRSLAPRTLEVARVPARPLATLPIKLRRDCIGTVPLENELTKRRLYIDYSHGDCGLCRLRLRAWKRVLQILQAKVAVLDRKSVV